MLILEWIKCDDPPKWCPLETVDLSGVTAKGVYIIWRAGKPSRVVYVGQGVIAERLAVHRKDTEILVHAENGILRVTWAAVPATQRAGVERHLADRWPPLVGGAFPDVAPIPVHSPW